MRRERLVVRFAAVVSLVALAGCVGEESPKFASIERVDVASYLPPGVEVERVWDDRVNRIGTQQSPVHRDIDVDLPASMSVAEFQEFVVDRLEADGWELTDLARSSDYPSLTLGRKTVDGNTVSFSIATLHQPPDVTVAVQVDI